MRKLSLSILLLALGLNTYAMDYKRYKGGCEFTASYQDIFTYETLFKDKKLSFRNNFVYTKTRLGPVEVLHLDRGFTPENVELPLADYKYLYQRFVYQTAPSLYTFFAGLPLSNFKKPYSESEGKQLLVSLIKSLVDEEYSAPLDDVDYFESYVDFDKLYARDTGIDNYSYLVNDRNFVGLTTDHTKRSVTIRYQLHLSPKVHNGASYHLYMRCFGGEEMKRVVRQ
ncbi:hypothetical protein [Halobacteriovorax sp. DA5]|uniref:hypothetical protein n=1 Tax=Halobacteriovorax sp. DA5 TaxID=2067553 RepID=UPI000CD105C2|nr:hypothetical protein [Halobacteriovorax sp. DA5]POB13580.1 hypothetical protein C0Z22_10475 [Halobacteriovorax sp. DA5]